MAAEPTTTENLLVSGEELAEMGDIGPCELVEGRIVPMSPTGFEHGDVEAALVEVLRQFVRAHKLGKVVGGEVGIYTRRNPDTVRGADVAFISNEWLAQRSSASYLDVAPDLVVEILSPHDRWSTVTQKLREYFAIGVRLVWIVDPSARSVHIYRALTDVREVPQSGELSGEEVLPGFVLPVAALFSS
jgi:Uma2 family endonuclease